MNQAVDYDDISFVLASEYRQSVASLDGRPATPTEFAEETDQIVTHTSRSLRELHEDGQMNCWSRRNKPRSGQERRAVPVAPIASRKRPTR